MYYLLRYLKSFLANVLHPQVIHVDHKSVNLKFSVTDLYPLRGLDTKILCNK